MRSTKTPRVYLAARAGGRCRCRPHLQRQRRARRIAVDVDISLRVSRGPHADARLRSDPRSRDGCVREELAAGMLTDVRFRVPAQPVDATQALNLSAGVSNPKVSRGRSLSCRATLFRWVCEYTDKSVPFGKYCLSRPLVFSLEPRCHGL